MTDTLPTLSSEEVEQIEKEIFELYPLTFNPDKDEDVETWNREIMFCRRIWMSCATLERRRAKAEREELLKRPINLENELKFVVDNIIDRLEVAVNHTHDNPERGQTHIGLEMAIEIVKELRNRYGIKK